MFYPAEAPALRRLIAATRASARERWRGRAEARRRAARRHRLFRLGRRDCVRPLGAARRAAEARSSSSVPRTATGFRGLALHPAAKWADPARRSAGRRRSRHAELAQDCAAVSVDARPFAGEHSLEMHLVMLQAMLPAPFEILPILVGDADPHDVAEALRAVWGGPETVDRDLLRPVALPRPEAAVEMDAETARRIEIFDAPAMSGARACGFLPIYGALEIAAERDLRVSGAASGDFGRRRRRPVARRRLRRVRVRIFRLGAARRRRPRESACGLHGGPRGGGAERRQARRRSASNGDRRRRFPRCGRPSSR